MPTKTTQSHLNVKHSTIAQIYSLFSTIEKYFQHNPKLSQQDFDDMMAGILDGSSPAKKFDDISNQHSVIAPVFKKLRALLDGSYPEFQKKFEIADISKTSNLIFPIAQNILFNRLFPSGAALAIKELKKENKLTREQILNYAAYVVDEVIHGAIDGITAPIQILGNLRQTINNIIKAAANPYETYDNMKEYAWRHPLRLAASMATGSVISNGLGFAIQGTEYASWANSRVLQTPIVTPVLNTEAQASLEKAKVDNNNKPSIDLIPLVEKFTDQLIAFNQLFSDILQDPLKIKVLIGKLPDIFQLLNDVTEVTRQSIEQQDFDSTSKLASIAKKTNLMITFIKLIQDTKDTNQLAAVTKEIHTLLSQDIPRYQAAIEEWLGINEENWLPQLQKACALPSTGSDNNNDNNAQIKLNQEQPDVLLGTKVTDLIQHSAVTASPGTKRKQQLEEKKKNQNPEESATKSLKTSSSAI